MAPRTIVIGAGVAGMTTALILARHGHHVSLVEAFPQAAPTLRGFHRGGIYFDTGLHYTGGLAPGEILDRYLHWLDLRDVTPVPYNPRCFDRFRFSSDGMEFSFPIGREQIQATLLDAFPDQRLGIITYLDDVRTAFESSPFLNPERDFSRNDLDVMLREQSLTDYLQTHFSDDRLKSILSMHSLLYGVSPDECPFSNHARIVGSYYQSVHGVNGGGRGVVHAFEQALNTVGVQTFFGQAAHGIVLDTTGDIRGVELKNGEILKSTQIVCTTHPSVLAHLLPAEAMRPAFRRHMQSLEDTPSAYMLFGISDAPLDLLDRSNLFVCPDTDVPSFFRPGRHPESGPFYIASTEQPGNATSRAIIAIAPGHASMVDAWKETHTGRRPNSYQQHKSERLKAMRDHLLDLAPELSSVRFIDGATPLTLRDYMRTPTGSLYGARHSIHQLNPMPVTRIPGLMLAGQSIVAPGLLGAIISAVLTCGFLVGHDIIRKELRACH